MQSLKRIVEDLPPKGVSIFLMIVGLLLGSVFSFGNLYWSKTISRDEAVSVTAEFASYKVHYRKGQSRNVVIYFSDYKLLDIDTYCATDEVIDNVASLTPGAKVEMLVHPNSDIILEMKTKDKSILTFNDSMTKLKHGRTGYLFISGFMYLCFGYGLFSLLHGIIHDKS
jgi:hypothetical protein